MSNQSDLERFQTLYTALAESAGGMLENLEASLRTARDELHRAA